LYRKYKGWYDEWGVAGRRGRVSEFGWIADFQVSRGLNFNMYHTRLELGIINSLYRCESEHLAHKWQTNLLG